MEYEVWRVEQALNKLSAKYPDAHVNNNKSMGTAHKRILITKDSYIRQSMKRSSFKNIAFKLCRFQNVALTGSNFRSVAFENTSLIGNSFIGCDFFAVDFLAENSLVYEANNFSQSNFTNCRLSGLDFVSTGIIQTLFHKCSIANSTLRGSTLEGSRFVSSEISGTDFGSANVEFIDLYNTRLDDVVFPFYQYPYIIGSADYLSGDSSKVFLRCGKDEISIAEYAEQIDNLILYFWDKSEYFPMCNLYIAQGNYAAAGECMLDGINKALHDFDFRMIRYFCKLAQRHNLLDEITTHRILQIIEEFMVGEQVPIERLNTCLVHLGEIRGILSGGTRDMVLLRLKVRSNVQKDNKNGLEYITGLSNQLSFVLAQHDYEQSGYSITVSNHSPYEIFIEVLTIAGSLASIASIIWFTIDKINQKKVAPRSMPDGVWMDDELYRKYVHDRIELFRRDMNGLKRHYSKQQMNSYIEEITQELQTDLESLHSSDIMIFKVKNQSAS